jgi:co-chaperonin GroES (HSP10)
MSTARKIPESSYQARLTEAFPNVSPNLKRVYGSRVLVQLRLAKRFSDGGIELPDEARETEKWNTQVARVIAIGPAAFRNRDTLELWPEGEWCKVGDYVRVPKYAGDRWEMDVPNSREKVVFVLFKDLDLLGESEDPLTLLAYI